MISKLPQNLQGVLWSRSVDKLDIIKDKNYIIHQILSSGSWENVEWLFKTYTTNDIRESFEKYPEKDYTQQSYNFNKNYLLNIDKTLDEKRYVKTFPRDIRQ